MTPEPDSGMPPAGDAGPSRTAMDAKPPANWREALMTLVSTRLTLIQLESREVATHVGRRAVRMATAAACAVFGWALLLAGGVALLASSLGLPWHWIALAVAAIHLLAAWLIVNSGRSNPPPAFPLTKAEFLKDREWIENLQKHRKS
jgi:hypothetical protein